MLLTLILKIASIVNLRSKNVKQDNKKSQVDNWNKKKTIQKNYKNQKMAKSKK